MTVSLGRLEVRQAVYEGGRESRVRTGQQHRAGCERNGPRPPAALRHVPPAAASDGDGLPAHGRPVPVGAPAP